jgi:hypothetical protein
MLAESAIQTKLDLQGGGTGLGLYFSATAAALHSKQGRTGLVRLQNGGALNGASFALYLP